jgi:ATP-dependent helicase HepA
MWKAGDRLTHRFNPDLGVGVVREVAGRTLLVEFPAHGKTLRLSADSSAIRPLDLRPGLRATLAGTAEEVLVAGLAGDDRVVLEDGREVRAEDLWPVDVADSLVERLATGDVSELEAFALRLDLLGFLSLREADGLGSFLGGRIRLFPHQLHVAERATRSDPVRWLLADEVGLGKTVEACLILNHLVRARRAERTLVVAPETLTVQWLGELWRKYHQVFVLLDDKRLADVERDHGRAFNPFDVHRSAVVSLERLSASERLAAQAVEAGIDLLIVDEAHHLRRPRGHPGNPAYRAVRSIADLGRHVLLLTATPLEEDVHGFFRLLEILRPEEFGANEDFAARAASAAPLPPCTSSTRREDIGGLPPRVPRPVALAEDEGWRATAALEAAMRATPAAGLLERRSKARRIRRALASGASLLAVLDPRDGASRELAHRALAADPRLDWLARRAEAWRAAGDKTLVFVAERETLEAIQSAIGRRALLRVGVFHEDLSAGERDIEVARFRLPAGPSMLVSTECGGEGRNFEFCTRLVMFDLPWSPITVEQRIGRLDRIGRTMPVEIVYFEPPNGIGAAVARLYESLGLFRSPLGGLERELADVERALEELALGAAGDASEPLETEPLAQLVERAHDAEARVRDAAYHELHREPYKPEMSEAILARVPTDLDELTREVVLAAAEAYDLKVESHRDGLRHSFEIGTRARIESLPGVPPGASWLGTFDREEAVQDESIDYYASGHPFVEGLLAQLEDDTLGRVALLDAASDEPGEEGFGLLALYRGGPTGVEAVAIDAYGRERPDWARRLARRPLRSRRVRPEAWCAQPGWPALIRTLARHLEGRGRPVALAAFRIGA